MLISVLAPLQVAFVDCNDRLYLQRVTQPSGTPALLHACVTAIKWHEESDVLVALSQCKMVCCWSNSTLFQHQLLLIFANPALEQMVCKGRTKASRPVSLLINDRRCVSNTGGLVLPRGSIWRPGIVASLMLSQGHWVRRCQLST